MFLNDTDPDNTSTPIPDFQKSDARIVEYKEAARDPQRTLAAHELSDDHSWDLATDLSKHELRLFKECQDEMYQVLPQQYTTNSGSKIRIKVLPNVVENISLCFARARMLNPDLARRTEAFFVEAPTTYYSPSRFQQPFHSNLLGAPRATTTTPSITKPIGKLSLKFSLNNW